MTIDQLPIFVYGSLRSQGSNHHYLAARFNQFAPAHLHGAAMSAVEFPYVWRSVEGTVVGELYWLEPGTYDEALAALDELEGFQGPGQDNEYERTVVTVMTADHSLVEAWTYLVNEAVGMQFPRVPSGDFLHRPWWP